MMNTRVEMNNEMMMQVNGGKKMESKYTVDPSQKADFDNEIHPGCGGHIDHQCNPFLDCECDRCGETHYWYLDFFKKIERHR